MKTLINFNNAEKAFKLTNKYFKLNEKIRRIKNLEIELFLSYDEKNEMVYILTKELEKVRVQIYKLIK